MSTENIIKFCPFCGSKVIPNARFCIECGKELNVISHNNSNEKSNDTKEDKKSINKPETIIEENIPNEITSNNTEEFKQIKDKKKKVKKSFSLLNKTIQDNAQKNEIKENKAKETESKEEKIKQEEGRKVNEQKDKVKNFEVRRPSSNINRNDVKEKPSVEKKIKENSPFQKIKTPKKNKKALKQDDNKKNQSSTDIKNVATPKQSNETNIITNSDGFACPSCGKNMEFSQSSGIFSSSNYHYCHQCQLKFKESDDKLQLEGAPEYTRMKSKLIFKKYTLSQWKNILHGSHTPELEEEFYKWEIESLPSFSCPACNHEVAKYKSSGFGSSNYVICSGCGLTLKEHKNNLYKLYDSVENNSPLWKYEKDSLSIEDIKRIIHTEESEESRLFREKVVKENERKLREHKLQVKQEKEDLDLFSKNLESGTPLLPVPSDTTVVLKKNELPVYKLYNITLSEPRAVRTRSGGYGGTSVRIAKGVTVHTGRTESTSESHDEIKEIDHGELLITNKRVIFLGSNRTTNIDLNKIISISSEEEMIQIQRSNKQKPEYFSNINATENFHIEGRQHTVNINGEIVKKLIIGLIN